MILLLPSIYCQDNTGTLAVKKLWTHMSKDDKAQLGDAELAEALTRAYTTAASQHHEPAAPGKGGRFEITVPSTFRRSQSPVSH